ncbi:MAG: beta-propeller fold lactonase family protein, partial [Planctomycetes bacterium]|nr:beta-propeller fold lactonase family protein [Planctomycetota bacterium]
MRRFNNFIIIIVLFSGVCFGSYGQGRHPVYVGVRQCAECHQGKSMGNQFSKWLHSKHARAYAVLSDPQSKEIAELSGIPEEPQESTLCLGCHATGAHAEDWEKEDTFFVEDGVQCEKCHGAGSEYIEVMYDREKAMMAGLMMPTMENCENCHQVKGSHFQVHSKPELDLKIAMDQIAHPTKKISFTKMASLPDPENEESLKYSGVSNCATCHKGPEKGYQFSKWRMSKHAEAYSVLATPKGYEIGAEKGISEPQRSEKCLKCHTTAFARPEGGAKETYYLDEGVGCEGCHGPEGKGFAANNSAEKTKEVAKEVCMKCHENAHGKTFDHLECVKEISHPFTTPEVVEKTTYKTPLGMAISPDGKSLYVTCEASATVIVVDVKTLKKIDEIEVGRQPTAVTFSPDGKKAYVSNRLEDTVSVIDTASRKRVTSFVVGDDPHGIVTDKEGKYLYALNKTADSISVIDTESAKEVKRLAASSHPWALSISPDGSKIYATNCLSRFVKFREPSISEITVIDTELAVVSDRIEVPAANMLLGIGWHPSGEFALATMNRHKNLVPMTRLLQGWTITNGLAVIWKDGSVDQVLLDEPGLYFPDPTDVQMTPDGKYALVTSSGSDRVAVIEIEKLVGLIKRSTKEERELILPNHLGKSFAFITKYIETKDSPRGIAITPDSKIAFAANSLDDSLTVIDLEKLQAVATVDLDGPKEIIKTRWGERLFHSANISFRRQFSCHSCHPDGHVDGLTYDIEPDGIGEAPVDNRTLRGILDTAPFKWEGTNPSLQRQCGPRLSVFFTRLQPFTPEQLSALDNYICLITRPPNRYRPLGAELTDAQRRGKLVFERSMTNDGRLMSNKQRCVSCHFPPFFTDRRVHDVGTKYI